MEQGDKIERKKVQNKKIVGTIRNIGHGGCWPYIFVENEKWKWYNQFDKFTKLKICSCRSNIVIEFREITAANLEDVLNLQIFEYQDEFVSSVAHSLAQAYVYYETAFPFAIYVGNTLVGFIMLGYYKSRNQYTLWKFMIDKQYQKKGYGKEALMCGIAYLREKFNVREVYTGVLLGNEIAKQLYMSVGFVETGIVEDNMIEMVYLFSEI